MKHVLERVIEYFSPPDLPFTTMDRGIAEGVEKLQVLYDHLKCSAS